MLRNRLGGIDGRRMTHALVKIAAATVLMSLAAYITEHLMETAWPAPRLTAQLVRVFGAIGVALTVLAVAAHLLRIGEFTEALAVLMTPRAARRDAPPAA
jgi:peptidoglycan biosynthesis protein MviN/MurJ (putative lipid II flippase)